MCSSYISRIKRLRREGRLTQQAVADYLHISQQTYSDYEQGKVRMQASILVKLAAFYGVTTDYICGLTDVRTPQPSGQDSPE